jgi:starch phosphorylase
MKACLNGGLHVSILDGWWCEAHDGLGGWAFGEGREYSSPDMQFEYDSRSLYTLLESRIVPLFFKRDADGLPQGWIDRMRHTLATVPLQFNTHRMVDDYCRLAYVPLGAEHARLAREEYAGAKERVRRHTRLEEAWEKVKIEDVSVPDVSRGSLGVGDHFAVHARVRLGDLKPEDVNVELYVGPTGAAGQLKDPVIIPLLLSSDPQNGVAEYTGVYLPRGAGAFQYGVRVFPALDSVTESVQLGLVRWA